MLEELPNSIEDQDSVRAYWNLVYLSFSSDCLFFTVVVIEIDLLADSFQPGRKLYDRVHWCLTDRLALTMSFLMAFIPHGESELVVCTLEYEHTIMMHPFNTIVLRYASLLYKEMHLCNTIVQCTESSAHYH